MIFVVQFKSIRYLFLIVNSEFLFIFPDVRLLYSYIYLIKHLATSVLPHIGLLPLGNQGKENGCWVLKMPCTL